MKKRDILTIILGSILVVVFNLLFFLNAGISHSTSVWVCYVFFHFAYLMVLLTPAIESKGKDSYISKLTTYAISFLYFLVEFALAVAVLIFKLNNARVIVSFEMLVTAVYLFALIPNLLVNDLVASR